MWTDYGHGDYGLYFIRDKEKREVDFVVTKNQEPWFLVEVKKSEQELSRNLLYFHDKIKPKHSCQVVLDMPFVKSDCFKYNEPIIVPASTFLAQLV